MAWLPQLGMTARAPKGGLYIWARMPEGADDNEWCLNMLHKAGVWITPGTAYGDYGKGYVRLSLCTPEERLKEAGERLLSV
jgi:LL-diaminopimelate aminotransferase